MAKQYSVILTGKAEDDLEECTNYIKEKSHDQFVAMNWKDSLEESLQRLEFFPHGYPRFLKTPYRKMLFGLHQIYFRIDEDNQEVLVCRIVQGNRLIENAGPME